MFVLRTVMSSPCFEGDDNKNNVNRQHVLSDVLVSIYPTTRRHRPESHNRNFLAVRLNTCVAARFFVHSTCRADCARQSKRRWSCSVEKMKNRSVNKERPT
jgi:hypothetical protein